MAISTLASASLEAGRALLIKLDELGLNPECVAWLHPHDSEGWRYIIGTGAVDVVGPSKLYMGLINLFDALDFGLDLTVDDVRLMSPDEPLLTLVQGGPRKQWNSVARVRGVASREAADVLIYRCRPTPRENVLRKQAHVFATGAARI